MFESHGEPWALPKGSPNPQFEKASHHPHAFNSGLGVLQLFVDEIDVDIVADVFEAKNFEIHLVSLKGLECCQGSARLHLYPSRDAKISPLLERAKCHMQLDR